MGNSLLAYGHRSRAPYLGQDQIPALEAGMLKAQQFGNDWYVNSSAAAGGDGATPASAKTTLAAALAIALSGDRIFIAPGHAENITAAGGITWSQSGITVIGLGVGSNRPTFTFTTTASTIAISGNNNILSNVRVTSSVDEMVLMFNVTGSFVTLDRVDHFETTSCQTIAFAAFTTGTDCAIQNCQHYQATAAAATQIWITATSNTRFRLLNNVFMLALKDAAAGAVAFFVTCTNILVQNNVAKMTGYSANLLSVYLSLNTTTGMSCYNSSGADVAAVTTIHDLPGCRHVQDLATLLVDKNGILDPVV
ncbi:MAG: hypothetical protein EBS84_22640 [Proteobacteria bacterium]|nr:hypothetical protein [Verrucomicrobiota bacterium]NBU11760.1 hypothetical protein [Pseudomonadota bacterium]